MSEIALQRGTSCITARLTPWDERALGFGTAEITRLDADIVADATHLLDDVHIWARDHDVRYLFGRVDANAHLLRGALQAGGFQFVETSLTVSRNGLGKLPRVPLGMLPTLRRSVESDVPTLRRIAQEDFGHGRFLEDPAIDEARSRVRTANWIEDLAIGGLAYTAESRGRIIGFHAERIHADDRRAELLLTGAAAPYAMLAMPLWVTALTSLAERNIERCNTLVSAANTGVVNLYAQLGFQFNSSLTGFRKFL